MLNQGALVEMRQASARAWAMSEVRSGSSNQCPQMVLYPISNPKPDPTPNPTPTHACTPPQEVRLLRRDVLFSLSNASGALPTNIGLVDSAIARTRIAVEKEQALPQLRARVQVGRGRAGGGVCVCACLLLRPWVGRGRAGVSVPGE